MKDKLLALARQPVVILLGLLVVLLLAAYRAWPLLGYDITYRLPALALVAATSLIVLGINALLADSTPKPKVGPSPLALSVEQAFGKLVAACPRGGALYRLDRVRSLPWVVFLSSPDAQPARSLSGHHFAKPFAAAGKRDSAGPATLWLAADAIFCEPSATHPGGWPTVLDFLAQRKLPVALAVLQVSAQDLLSSAGHAKLAERFHEQLTQLRERGLTAKARLPVCLLVNDVHRLDGFARFFANISYDERSAPWAFSIGDAAEQSIGEAVKQQTETLVGSLLQRLSSTFLPLGGEDQTALLGFPLELERFGGQVAAFANAVFYGDDEAGMPSLSAVYLASAPSDPPAESKPVLPGRRWQISDSAHQVALKPETPPAGQSESMFLRDALQRIQRQARDAAPAHRRWHALSLAVALCACAGGSLFLGKRFAHHNRWLQGTQGAVQALAKTKDRELQLNDDGTELRDELYGELRVVSQLCQDWDSAKGKEPVCGPEELTASAHAAVLRMVRCRIGHQLLAPLVFRDSANGSKSRPIYKQLDQAATWSKEKAKNKGAGQALLNGFRALKAVALIQKRYLDTPDCPTPDFMRDVPGVAGYLADLWDYPDHRDALRKSLEFFFWDYKRDRDLQPLLPFTDKQRLETARQRLKSSSTDGGDLDGEAEDDFYLIASELGLLEGKGQTYLGRVIKNEVGLPPVYTADGCAKFFDPNLRWDGWMNCVRGTARVRDPRLDPPLQAYYLRAHREAWSNWLAGLTLKNSLNPEEPARVIDALQGISDDLRRVLQALGGPHQVVAKAEGPAGAQDKPRPRVRVCQQARHSFIAAPFTAGLAVEMEEENPNLVPAYKAYLDEVPPLLRAMQGIIDWKVDPQAPLGPYDAVLRAVDQISRQRRNLFEVLGAEINRPEAQPIVQLAGLARVLSAIEDGAREAAQVRLRKVLDSEWEKIYKDWKTKKVAPGETVVNPGERIGQLRTLFMDQVGAFTRNYIDRFYADLGTCRLQATEGAPAQQKQLLSSEACTLLASIRKALARSGGSPAAAPAGGPPPLTEAQRPKVALPPINGCGTPPQSVSFDVPERSKRYQCYQTNNWCDEAGPSSGQASVAVSYDSPKKIVMVASARNFAELIDGRDKPNRRKLGRIATVFEFKEGTICGEVELYLHDVMKVSLSSANWPGSMKLLEKITYP